MQIKEIKTREEIAKSYDVLIQIYENLKHETYIGDILEMMKEGYKMAGVFEDDNRETCIGIVGVRIVHKIHYGKSVEIEDFMIDRQRRGIGVGKMLMRWVEWQSVSNNCKNIIGILESKRLPSQKIYSREKFEIEGLFFAKSS